MNFKIHMKNNILFFSLIVLFITCTTPQPRKPVIRKTSTFLKESIERNKIINKIEEAAFNDLMAQDSTYEYLNSDNGFWYYYVKKDSLNDKFPVKGDVLSYTYEIKDINKKVLYTKEELGLRTYKVDQQELISGLQDGLKLMKVGETVTFLFPSHKAYGYAGYDKINSGQPLIYTVTLEKINSK